MQYIFKRSHALGIVLLAGALNIGPLQAQNLELPYYRSDQTITSHTGYTLLYNEEHEQAEWIAYELTGWETGGNIDRTDNFRADPSISTGSAALADYRGSGYDRGHLIPAADVAWSLDAMSASFFLSNMSPQHPSFNRGGWKTLEGLVRGWAYENGSVYVVTGPALSQGIIRRIGPNRVSVPRYYYKVILDYRKPGLKGIGFIMPNQKLSGPIAAYAVTVDSVESFTGLDFYPALPDSLEEAIESSRDLALWNFSANGPQAPITTTTDTNQNEYTSTASRCLGTTQKGAQCKRRTTNTNGYCWQHQSQVSKKKVTPVKKTSGKCQAITQKGAQCKRTARAGSSYCWQHQ